MCELRITTEKRPIEPPEKTAIYVEVDDEAFRHIWTLRDDEMTADVMKALKSAVDIGISLARLKAAKAVSDLRFVDG